MGKRKIAVGDRVSVDYMSAAIAFITVKRRGKSGVVEDIDPSRTWAVGVRFDEDGGYDIFHEHELEIIDGPR